jgi:quercetin dioxygenase-like cupin family protein
MRWRPFCPINPIRGYKLLHSGIGNDPAQFYFYENLSPKYCTMKQHFFEYDALPVLPVQNNLFDVRFISTDNITVAFNLLKKGAAVPPHEHLHETIDYVLEGELEMTVDEETVLMQAGMVARVPSHTPHSARAVSDCRVINIFYPVREDFAQNR